jgi:Putative DNA-binding domain
MLSLRDLQKRFDSALFDATPDAVAPWIRGCHTDGATHTGIDARARLAIYSNNLREGFIKALGLEFPVIARLVGADYFRQLALSFLAKHPSRAGDLHGIGKPFADFLRPQFDNTQYAYLADVAVLEWALSTVTGSGRRAALRSGGVARNSPGSLRATTLSPPPRLRAGESPYPVVRIWAVNQPEATGDEAVDLSSGANTVLLRRAAEGVEMRRIAAAERAGRGLRGGPRATRPMGFHAARSHGPRSRGHCRRFLAATPECCARHAAQACRTGLTRCRLRGKGFTRQTWRTFRH